MSTCLCFPLDSICGRWSLFILILSVACHRDVFICIASGTPDHVECRPEIADGRNTPESGSDVCPIVGDSKHKNHA